MRAAQKKHPHAQLMVGRYLAQGAAGRTDPREAMQWLRRAKAQGITDADQDIQRLGQMGVA